MAAKTYYEILDVEPTATAEEIKQSRRLLRAAWHPDKFKGTGKKQAEEKFKDIEQAYDVLSNPQKRAVYDSSLAYQRSAEANHQHAQEAQQRQEEGWRRREEEGRRRDNQQQAEERRQRENQPREEEARRRREAEERAEAERRRREEESRRQERQKTTTPQPPVKSRLWFTLSISVTVISFAVALITTRWLVYLDLQPTPRFGGMFDLRVGRMLLSLDHICAFGSALLGMLFSYLAMRSGRRTGGMVMMVINGALTLMVLLFQLVLIAH